MSTPPAAPPRTRRDRRDLHNLPRWPSLSHLYRAAEAAAPPNFPPTSLFAPSALWGWIRSYLAYAFKQKHDFPPHTAAGPSNALYALGGDDGSPVRIALAGDWATGTQSAANVAARMKVFDPHFTLHIGDVYYVGDPPEVNENCLGVKNPNNNYDPTTWHIGSVGSFALNGNHEMYANGGGYFDLFLPRLGLCGADGHMSGQQTSFFCLQNNFWRILAIDTGYNSIGIPILSQIPGINSIPGVGGDCKLEKALRQWLTDVVMPQQDPRGLVLLSHHQYYSGFETRYRKPAKQLWKAGVQRPVLWFWGHEHRLAGYDLFGSDDLKAFGRCVGHGGMPLELGAPTKQPTPIFYDNRSGGPDNFGINGHVNLTFQGPNLSALYVDSTGAELLSEQWSVDASGAVQPVARQKLINDPEFHA